MYGNPLYQWLGLAVSTALMLPLPVAMPAGWTPPWMRKRQAGLRFRACSFLCFYALVLLNTLPRLANASLKTVMTCMTVGYGFIAAFAVLSLLARPKDARAQAAGPGEPMPSPH